MSSFFYVYDPHNTSPTLIIDKRNGLFKLAFEQRNDLQLPLGERKSLILPVRM
jgi:hypothetical protein